MLTTQTETSAGKGKLLVILNPIAGKGKALTAYLKIEEFLRNHGENYEIILTKGPGDAIEIARNYPIDQDTAVVAAGGDGTCNEVVNGLLTRQEPLPFPPLFGHLPIGRGNDFSYTARIPDDLEKALEILIQRKTVPLDAGFVTGGYFPEGRYFVNGLGIGFDTKVGLEAARMKRVHSALSYALGAIIMMIRLDPSPRLEVKYDDKSLTIDALIVSLMNGQRMGGSFYMGPQASLNDGALDMCTATHRSRLQICKLILGYTKGTQEACGGVTMGRAMNFSLKALKGGMTAHCDGETVCLDGKELSINCRPGVLRLICS
ncbi:diacylglycerol kinase [Spirochaetia bacterium]|nr:diacylglycerol kinase [Spirochaetia bacterium]